MAPKILAVDDHPETLDIIVATLQGNGFQVVSTRQPVQALSLALREMPDLMLVDKNMPGMNGDEVVAQVRAEDRLKDIPIIMFTAENDIVNKVSSFDAGANDYLIKPTNPVELVERIQTLLASSTFKPSAPLPAPVDEPAEPEEMDSELNDILAQLELLDGSSEPEPAEPVRKPQGKITAVIGARGGAGTTTIAINLAVALSEVNHKTALADLDFDKGHIAHYFGKRFSVGLSDLSNLHPETFVQQLEQIVEPHGSMLQLLLTKGDPLGQKNSLTSRELDQLQTHLRATFEEAICDMGSGFSAAHATIWQKAARIIIVTRPEKVALMSARALLKELQQSVSSSVIHLVLLNIQEKSGLPQNTIESFLRHKISASFFIPTNALTLAANKNKPLLTIQPQSKLANDIRAFARAIAE